MLLLEINGHRVIQVLQLANNSNWVIQKPLLEINGHQVTQMLLLINSRNQVIKVLPLANNSN